MVLQFSWFNLLVIPAKAGIQWCFLDSGFRRSDGLSTKPSKAERYRYEFSGDEHA